MFQKMSALDRKWLSRIILKKMGLGLGIQKVLQIYHPRANDYYNRYTHLSRVCEIIDSGVGVDADSFDSNAIELFRPIHPMLCERGYISKIDALLKDGDYYLETKMDGERFHVHIKDKQFRYFTRNCNEDFTKKFGNNHCDGLFSPTFHRLLNERVKNAIFDGEMMVWHRQDGKFLTKAENISARNLNCFDPELNACFCVYDIIYLNDECLAGKPYAERCRLLKTLFNESKGNLMLCYRVKLNDSAHFVECLNKAFDNNEEGVVIKRADSTYQAGKREKSGWFKIKPDVSTSRVTPLTMKLNFLSFLV